MGKSPTENLDLAKRVMGALVRQPPKPHDEMKVGKPTPKGGEKRQKKTTAKRGR